VAPPRKQAENRENKRLPTALVGSCLLEKMRKLEGEGKINFCFSNLLPQTLSEAILQPNAAESVRQQTYGEAINRYGKQPLEM
jgi:hypothetical protein